MNALHDVIALQALLETCSVTLAASRLGVTQSAMSHTLARLRERLDDPLLVRSGKGMVLTTRAEQMAPRLRASLADLDSALAEASPFHPQSARHSFRLDTADYGELVLLPPLIERVSTRAPGVDLRVTRSEQSWEDLERGEVDLQLRVLSAAEEPAGARARALVRERFVCLMRRDHPLTDGPLTLERFADARHALIAPRGGPGGPVDNALERVGLRRRVVLSVPHFLAVPYVIASSDLVITLPERVARCFAESLPVVIVEPPLQLPGFTVSMVWHERRDRDPAHIWLRVQMTECAPGLDLSSR